MKIPYLFLGFILGLATLALAQSTALAPSDARFQDQKILLGYPPVPLAKEPGGAEPGPVEWSPWNLRMFQADSNTTDTAEKAEKLAEYLKTRGFNLVLIGSGSNSYLFRDPGDEDYAVTNPPFPDVIRNAGFLVEALHKRGIQALLHTTCSMVTKQFVERHPSWASIDQTNGKPIFTSSKTYGVCIANPEFQNAFLERLEEFLAKTKADTAMVDETSWWAFTACVCPYCREAFKRDTGLELPAPGSGTGFFNAANPVYRRFLEWRRRIKLEFDQRVSAVVWKYGGADALRSTYFCNPLYMTMSWIGMDYTDWLLAADSIGYECEPAGHLYLFQWPHVIAEMKYMQALARHTPGAPWTLFYSRLTGDPIFCWFMALSQGSRVWGRDPPEELPLRNWEINHEALWNQCRPLANVGLLQSPWTVNLNPKYQWTWYQGFEGVCDALTEQAFPYRVIIERDLLQREGPGVDVIFALNTANLSMEMVEGLTRFVRNGGVLISSGDVSLFDRDSNPRSDFLLSAVIGASWKATVASKANKLAIDAANELTGELTGSWTHDRPFREVKLHRGAKAIGEMRAADGKASPAIVLNSFGRGFSVYFTGHPEMGNFFTSYDRNIIKAGEPWKDDRDVKWQKLLVACARYQNHQVPLEVENVAPGIVVEAHRQLAPDLKGIQVHLANLLGGNLKDGVVPARYDISFPEVKPALPDPKKPIKVKVRLKDAQRAYLLSPDFDEVVRLPIQKDGEWVGAELDQFARYAILYFCQGSDERLLRMGGGKAVTTLPKVRELVYRKSPPFAGRYDKDAIYLFSDLKQMKGGKDTIPLYKGVVAPQIAYGAKTAVSTIRGSFKLATLPDSATLEFGGCDDNAETKAPMEILVNDRSVYKGPSPFPDDDWGRYQLRVGKEVLRAGENSIVLKNTGDSDLDSMPPWFMIHFIKIRLPNR